MAFFDDALFIISHIRNSYITSDDTGMCEAIMVNEDLPIVKLSQKLGVHCTLPLESFDSCFDPDNTEIAHSYDIASDMDLGAHRRRSNTAQRLDRLKKERQSQSKIQNIQWKDNSDNLTEEEASQFFSKKDLGASNKVSRKSSLLSNQLDKFCSVTNNPFYEYAKYDGNAYTGIPTKKINIFLTMLPPDQRAYPMPVIVLSSAKVQDLIGLTCWKYMNEGREPKLKENIDYYSLHIAEDDGEVDIDFPSLDCREVISKFGFFTLALVEKETPHRQQDDICITVHIPGEGFSTLTVDGLDVTVREILDKTLKRRRGYAKAKGLEYQLEKHDEPGVALQLDTQLSVFDKLEFYLVRANSKRFEEYEDEKVFKGIPGVEAPLYQSYRVYLLSKVRPKMAIHLGISGEKIEIDPVNHKGSAKLPWTRNQKPISHDIDLIAACYFIGEKNSGKSVLRLVYHSSNSIFKHHDFETEASIGKEIVQKVNNILEMRSSQVRRDYMDQVAKQEQVTLKVGKNKT